MATKTELLRNQLACFESQDWQRYQETFVENSHYEEEATQRRVSGPEAITEVMKSWKKAFPDARAELKDVVEAGDAAIAELEWSGTQNGPLVGPYGTIQPTGRHGKIAAVIVARFEGDQVRELHHYFDMLGLLMQLGIGPAAPSPEASR